MRTLRSAVSRPEGVKDIIERRLHERAGLGRGDTGPDYRQEVMSEIRE
jgi:hypothetical protein